MEETRGKAPASLVFGVCRWPCAARRIGRGAQYFGRNKVQYRTFTFPDPADRALRSLLLPRGEADAAQIASRAGGALVRAAVALLRPRAARPAGAHPLRVRRAFPADERDRRTDRRRHGRRHRGAQAAHRAADVRLARRHRSRDRPRARPRVPVRHDGQRSARWRRPAAAGHPAVSRCGSSKGMAEYLSLGPVDAQTAMWMRDAALREKLPTIRDLDKPEYFPYRWGHAFWAFVGAKYGDRAVASLVRSAANPRFDLVGLARQLGTDPDTLTADWHHAIRAAARSRRATAGRRSRASRAARSARRAARAASTSARAEPGRQADRVLLRARSLLDRSLSGGRRDRAASSASSSSRRPIRTSTASSS